MKYVAVLVFLVAAVCGAWFFHTFTIIKTQASEEFLVLRTEQAKECLEGGGCAVYSGRERNKELNAFLQYLVQRGYMQPKTGI